MNVTDSLDVLSLEIERAKNCLTPAARTYGQTPGASPQAMGIAFGRVLDTLAILDEALDLARRERIHLDEAAKLLRTKACAACAEDFEYAPGASREPDYCSARCRQAAYRSRRARAAT